MTNNDKHKAGPSPTVPRSSDVHHSVTVMTAQSGAVPVDVSVQFIRMQLVFDIVILDIDSVCYTGD